jgi:MFS family permease
MNIEPSDNVGNMNLTKSYNEDNQDTLLGDKKKIDISKLRISHCYLIMLTCVVALSSAMFGCALTTTGQIIPNLKYALNWEKDEVDQQTSYIVSASVIGLAFGSIFGGKVVSLGLRRVIIIFDLVAIIACFISIVPNMIVLCIGRFIFGIAAGVLVSTGPSIIAETVPSSVYDRGYGVSTNVIFNVMILVSMIFGFGLTEKTEEERMMTDYWKWVFGFPVILLVLSIICMFTLHRHDSIDSHVRKGQKEDAKYLISRVYPGQTEEVYQAVYESIDAIVNGGDNGE